MVTRRLSGSVRYILFHGKCHPAEMGAAEFPHVLTSLAADGKVGAVTKNQALSERLVWWEGPKGHYPD